MSKESESYVSVLQSQEVNLIDSVDSISGHVLMSRPNNDIGVKKDTSLCSSFSLNADSMLQKNRCFTVSDSLSLSSRCMDGFSGIKRNESLGTSPCVHGVLLTCFVLFACVLSLGSRLYEQVVGEVLNLRTRGGSFVDNTLFGFKLCLSFLVVILQGLISYNLIRELVFADVLRGNHLLGIALFGVVFLVFQLFRVVLTSLLITLFAEPRSLRFYLSEYISMMSLWGVLLFPIAILMVFLPLGSVSLAIIVASLFVLWKLFMIYKSVKLFFGKKGDVIYVILYLCALEILPLIALFQVLIIIYSYLQ